MISIVENKILMKINKIKEFSSYVNTSIILVNIRALPPVD